MLVVNRNQRMGRHVPVATIGLIFACLVVALSQLDASPRYIYGLRTDLAFIPIRDFQLSFNFMFHAISYQFIHSSMFHFIFNMLALWVFGAPMEACFGRVKFLALYLCGGVAAILLQNMIGNQHPETAIIGASGSVASVMGAYLLIYGRMKLWILLVVIPVKMHAFMFILIWALINLFLATGENISGMDTGVALWAHLGGFLFGVMFCLLLKPAHIPFWQQETPTLH